MEQLNDVMKGEVFNLLAAVRISKEDLFGRKLLVRRVVFGRSDILHS